MLLTETKTNEIKFKSTEEVMDLIAFTKECNTMCSRLNDFFVNINSDLKVIKQFEDGTELVIKHPLSEEDILLYSKAKLNSKYLMVLNNLLNKIGRSAVFPTFVYTEEGLIDLENKEMSLIMNPFLSKFETVHKIDTRMVLDIINKSHSVYETRLRLKDKTDAYNVIPYMNTEFEKIFNRYGHSVKFVSLIPFYDLADVALINLDYGKFASFYRTLDSGIYDTTLNIDINNDGVLLLYLIVQSVNIEESYTLTFEVIDENTIGVTAESKVKNYGLFASTLANLTELDAEFIHILNKKSSIKETVTRIAQEGFGLFRELILDNRRMSIYQPDFLNKMIKIDSGEVTTDTLKELSRMQLICFKNELLFQLKCNCNWMLIEKYIDVEVQTDGIYVCVSKDIIKGKRLSNIMYKIESEEPEPPVEPMTDTDRYQRADERGQIIMGILTTIDPLLEFKSGTTLYTIISHFVILDDLIDYAMYKPKVDNLLNSQGYISIDKLFEHEALGIHQPAIKYPYPRLSYQEFRDKLRQSGLNIVLKPRMAVRKDAEIIFDIVLV